MPLQGKWCGSGEVGASKAPSDTTEDVAGQVEVVWRVPRTYVPFYFYSQSRVFARVPVLSL